MIWMLLGLVAVWLLIGSLFKGGPQEIDTSQGLKLLADHQVKAVKIVDGEQRVDLTLTKELEGKGTLVRFYYV